jgi:hypothetical protein
MQIIMPRAFPLISETMGAYRASAPIELSTFDRKREEEKWPSMHLITW